MTTRTSFLSVFSILLLVMSIIPVTEATPEPTLVEQIRVVVNEDVILQSEITNQLKLVTQQLRQRSISPPPIDILEQQLLERMITDNLQMQLAEKSGIRIDEDEVTQAIRDIAQQNNLSLSQLRRNMEKDQISYASFREQIRKEIILSRTQQRFVSGRIQISDQEIEQFLNSELANKVMAADYQLAHIFLSLPDRPEPEIVSEQQERAQTIFKSIQAQELSFEDAAIRYSQGQLALKGGDLGWRSEAQLPSLFVEQVRSLKPNEITRPFRSPNGFHLLKLNAKRGGTERLVPQTKVRHILIKPNQIRTDQQSLQLIEDLARQLDAGAQFKDLARIYSDDPGSAVSGGELGWVTPSGLTPEFAKIMQATAVGARSEPFRSEYGWHILQVEDRREQDMSEEYQKNRARDVLFQQRYPQELQAWLREIRQEAYVDFKTAQQDNIGVSRSESQ